MADALAVAKIRELAASLSQVLDEDPDQADCPATTSLMGDDDVMDEELKSRLLTRIVDLESKTKDLQKDTARISEENARLHTGNEVLKQYVENLLMSSGMFQRLPPARKE